MTLKYLPPVEPDEEQWINISGEEKRVQQDRSGCGKRITDHLENAELHVSGSKLSLEGQKPVCGQPQKPPYTAISLIGDEKLMKQAYMVHDRYPYRLALYSRMPWLLSAR